MLRHKGRDGVGTEAPELGLQFVGQTIEVGGVRFALLVHHTDAGSNQISVLRIKPDGSLQIAEGSPV